MYTLALKADFCMSSVLHVYMYNTPIEYRALARQLINVVTLTAPTPSCELVLAPPLHFYIFVIF